MDEKGLADVFNAIGGENAKEHIKLALDAAKKRHDSPTAFLAEAVETFKAEIAVVTHLAAKVGIGEEAPMPSAPPATPDVAACEPQPGRQPK